MTKKQSNQHNTGQNKEELYCLHLGHPHTQWGGGSMIYSLEECSFSPRKVSNRFLFRQIFKSHTHFRGCKHMCRRANRQLLFEKYYALITLNSPSQMLRLSLDPPLNTFINRKPQINKRCPTLTFPYILRTLLRKHYYPKGPATSETRLENNPHTDTHAVQHMVLCNRQLPNKRNCRKCSAEECTFRQHSIAY